MVFPSLSLLLILSSLLHTTSSTVFYVIPDDHYTTNNNTYTLQHYLNNTNKYFTSHTQLHFLPGQYYLNTDLIIQHVSNLSLIGNRTNEVINSVIKCTSPAGIVVVGSSNIVIANIVMNECGSYFNNVITVTRLFTKYYQSLLILDCQTVTCKYFHSKSQHYPSGVKFANVLGNTTISHVVSSHLKVWYTEMNSNMSRMTHTIHIESYHSCGTIYYYTYTLDIQMFHSSVYITVTILNINFQSKFALRISSIDPSGQTTITITNCSFSNKELHPIYDYKHRRNDDDSLVHVCDDYSQSNIIGFCKMYPIGNFVSKIYYFHSYDKKFVMSNKIQLIGCSFENDSHPSNNKVMYFLQHSFQAATITTTTQVSLTNCLLYNNSYAQPMSFESYSFDDHKNPRLLVLIKNVTVSYGTTDLNIINIHSVILHIESFILTSSQYRHERSTIIAGIYSYVEFNGYNEFSNNWKLGAIFKQLHAISSSAVHLQENSILNFTLNRFSSLTISQDEEQFNMINNINGILTCAIQYTSQRGNLDMEFKLEQKLNYSIVLYKNINAEKISTFSTLSLLHCAWNSASAFINSIPFHVNQKFITSDSFVLEERKKSVCLCILNNTYNCYRGSAGPFYPGQTVVPHLALNNSFINAARIEIKEGKSEFICRNENLTRIQLESGECKALKYRIKHSKAWCELSLIARPLSVETPTSTGAWTEQYTILLQACPKGFSLHPQGYCQCDPILSSYIPSLTTCDINHQTIPRPANTWISAHTINNSHSYHVSLHCPFDYCLPHSSQLNLSTPDSQCQFNRSGVLCGQCQHGLSTVFGSSQCKHCSNINLLMIIPFGMAGIVLVLLLFALNLTVTNGDIYPFLLYTNIVNINTSIFFQKNESILYTFTSLTNLDLGIETCFYNGMNDYDKMWLQLAFPIYLIFIATLLIITSRYSTTIQRLTARRALPVLVTLFLLSYTKVLLTVSNVLFSYTSSTHLPSNHTTLVWSVDTSVPLFGVKFTILFIACLILFLILVPFNVVLIFTKKLSYFKVVTYFKPLLDAYQGPYKIKFHYWTGLQLLIRAIFFGLTALERNINLTVGTLLIVMLIWIQEKMIPFKSKLNNYMEILCLFNVFVIFVASLYTTSNQIVVNVFVSLVMIQLLCIILWHIKSLIWNNRPTKFCPPGRFTNCLNIFNFKAVRKMNCLELDNEVSEIAHN